ATGGCGEHGRGGHGRAARRRRELDGIDLYVALLEVGFVVGLGFGYRRFGRRGRRFFEFLELVVDGRCDGFGGFGLLDQVDGFDVLGGGAVGRNRLVGLDRAARWHRLVGLAGVRGV